MTDVLQDGPTQAAPKVRSPGREAARQFFSSAQATFGAVVLTLLLLSAIFCQVIAPQNPYDLMQVNFLDSMLPPGETGSAGFMHVFGTDAQGRDMLSAILYGLRISVAVALSSVLLALVVGMLLGLLSAYIGGRFDSVLMRIVDIQMSFPALLIALILLAMLGPGIDKIMISIAVVYWAYFARIARGAALVERRKEYMDAAICLGLPRWRLVVRHLLPNCLNAVVILGTTLVARAVNLEAALSFLGLGTSITRPSLGLLISNGFDFILSGEYWISVFPGVALLLLALSINLVGDRMRDVLNPRLQK